VVALVLVRVPVVSVVEVALVLVRLPDVSVAEVTVAEVSVLVVRLRVDVRDVLD
jgi:hypothetical protein